jgi:acetylornithine deacetylase/succinyl-diaminopimelate desuccinylase-like protein
VPLPDNPIAALSRALARVHDGKQPARVGDVTRAYFGGLARVEQDPAMRQAMQAISVARSQADVDKADAVLSRDPVHNAVLRDAASLTMVSGGIRANVIPSDATATLNARILPDSDIRAYLAELNRIGAERQVTFAIQREPQKAPPVSSTKTPLYLAMESVGAAMAPEAAVVPTLSTGATDGAALRAAGIPTYGILPLPLEQEDELRMHGDNERVPVAALGWGTEYLYRVLSAVAMR